MCVFSLLGQFTITILQLRRHGLEIQLILSIFGIFVLIFIHNRYGVGTMSESFRSLR